MKYRWMSEDTGELQCSLVDVIKAIIWDYKYFKVLSLNWKYNREGF